MYNILYIIIKDIIIKEQLRIVSKIIFLITVIIVLLEKQQNYKMKITKEIFYYE